MTASPSSSTVTLACEQLQLLRASIDHLAQHPTAAATLGQQARQAQALLQLLPPRYGDVLLNLLDRLESSALFSEESCSFSHQELHQHLAQWALKAQTQLDALAAE